MTRWEDVARATAGDDYAETYARRFRELEESGQDAHGEATFVADLVSPPARILDAGCGTGRIAIRLASLGYAVVGTDVDERMLEVARGDSPALDWRAADLATLELDAQFDVVLLAGNVIPLLEPGTLDATCRRLAAHTGAGGRVVCGFGYDEAHLPPGCPVTSLTSCDAAMETAGLRLVSRYSTWDRAPFEADGGYAVSVHDFAQDGAP